MARGNQSWPNLPTSRAVVKGELFVNVKDYGAKGDNTTDDTAAIQAAINAVGAGGRVFFPPGRYRAATRLDLNNGQYLIGAGYYIHRDYVSTNGMHAGYLDTAMINGSVIRSEVTSGDAILHVKTAASVGGGMQDLVVIGPGTGTSNGIKFGNTAPRAVLNPVYRNVLVCNFSVGLSMLHVNEGHFSSVLIKGCTKAVSEVDDVNNVTWSMLNMQRCGQGLVMESGGALHSNSFISPLCQNITSEGFVLRGEGHTFVSPYFEAVGTTNIMDLVDCKFSSFQDICFHGAGPKAINIQASALHNTFFGIQTSAGTLTVTNLGTGNQFTGNLTSVSGAGGNLFYTDTNAGYTQAPSFRSTAASIPAMQCGGLLLGRQGSSGPQIRWVDGTPEGQVALPVGSLCLRRDGGAGTVLYVKETGTGNTGWVAK